VREQLLIYKDKK